MDIKGYYLDKILNDIVTVEKRVHNSFVSTMYLKKGYYIVRLNIVSKGPWCSCTTAGNGYVNGRQLVIWAHFIDKDNVRNNSTSTNIAIKSSNIISNSDVNLLNLIINKNYTRRYGTRSKGEVKGLIRTITSPSSDKRNFSKFHLIRLNPTPHR